MCGYPISSRVVVVSAKMRRAIELLYALWWEEVIVL